MATGIRILTLTKDTNLTRIIKKISGCT
ncbi:hypothetical protein BSG1_14233 [Bacillus sp. SG-1]|nr:hypothetical protein BSG1_14233 [Bacillus sp. SG-1]